LLAKGIKILQGNRLAPTDEEHVTRLADYIGLNGEHNIADLGCGFGEVSKLLSSKTKAARFWLVNRNEFQMEHCPVGEIYRAHLEDMCATSIPDGTMDLAMFNWSLCHVDAERALAEARRISAPDGRLFIYDYERTGADNRLTREYLFAHFLTDADLRECARVTGWREVETIHPGGDDTSFREAIGNDSLYNTIVKDLRPVIWKAKRQ